MAGTIKQMGYEINLNVNKASYTNVINTLNQLSTALGTAIDKNKLDKSMEDSIKQWKEAKTAAQQLEAILDQTFKKKMGQYDLKELNEKINGTFTSLDNLKKILVESGDTGTRAWNLFGREVLNTNLQLSESSKLLDTMADTMAKTVRWGIASRALNNMVGSIEKAWSFSVKLDSSLNNIRIVTGKGADEMERFAVTANKAAKALGASTKDYTDAALIYYQQGLSDQEAQRRAEITLKAANVTGQSAKQVSEQLTAVWNGYNVAIQESELYVDKLAAVAASTASDLEELSTGMSKVASAAATMGVDIDQLNAQMATIISVTRQAPESVGTALRTIYARMGDIKAGLDAETTLGNYTEKMAALGINVLDANGKLRDMGAVVEEVGSKWTAMTKEQQVALAQTMAGTRQYNNLLTLFNNWDMYTKALETSTNAAGTLQKQQDTYMESTEAHLQKMRTEAEKTYDILFDTKTVNGFIDAFTNLNGVLNTFLKSLGGGTNTFIYFGALLSNIFNKQIADGLNNTIQKINNFKENTEKLQIMRDVVNLGYTRINTTGKEDEKTKLIREDYENAKQLLDIQKSISNEEFNRLNTLRQEAFVYKDTAREIKASGGNTQKAIQNKEKELKATVDQLEKFKELHLQEKQSKDTNTDRIKLLRESLTVLKDIVDVENLRARINIAKKNDDTQELKRLEKELEVTLKKSTKDTSKELEIMRADAEKTSEEFYEMGEAKQEALVTGLEAGKWRSDATSVIKSISSIVQVFVSLDGIIKTIQDDSLDASEKLKLIGTSALSILSSVAFNWKDLKAFGGDLLGLLKNPAFLKAAIAVTAITAAIGGIIYVATKEQREIKNLRDEADKLSKKAEETEQSLTNLKNSFDGYTNAIDTLQKCTEGTEAWNSALKEVNTAVLDILEKYPDLAKISNFITRDEKTGQLSVDTEALKNYENQLERESQQQKISSITLNAEADRREYERNQKNIVIDINTRLKGLQKIESDINNILSGPQRGTLQYPRQEENLNQSILSNDQISELMNLANYSDGYSKKVQELIDNMLKAGQVTEKTAEDWTKSLLSSRDKFIELSKAQEENSNALKNSAKLAASAALGSGSSNVAQRLFAQQYIDTFSTTQGNLDEVLKLNNYSLANPYMSGDDDKLLAKVAKAGNFSTSFADTILRDDFDVNELNKEQYDSLLAIKDSIINAINESGIDGASSFVKTFDAALKKEWNEDAHKQFLQDQFKSTLQETATSAAAQYNLDEKDLQNFGQYLADIADESDELADTLDEDGKAASVVAQSLMRMNRAVETLADNWKNWRDILENSTEESEEYWNALSKMQEALGDLLDINKEAQKYFSDDFIKKYADSIDQAAQGSAEAIDFLRDKFADEVILRIGIENKLDDSIVSDLSNTINDLQSRIPDIEVGYSITGDDTAFSSFLQDCQKIVEDAQMTAEQANAFFASMGFDAEFAQTPVENESTRPVIETTTYEDPNPSYITYESPGADGPIPHKIKGVKTITSSKVIGYDKSTEVVMVPSYATKTPDGQGRVPKATKITKKGTGSFNNYSSRNAGGGSPGKSRGGGSSKQPNIIDPIEKEKDRYHDVNIQLKQISNELDKLDKQKEKLFGKDLIENLNKQLDLLNNQIDTTNEKMKIAEGEAQELKGKLASSGVTFNADGTISNYAQAYQAQLDYVNSIINQYNSMDAEAQEGFKDTVEKAKENFEKFVDNIDRYDEVITDLIPGLAADIQEAIDKQIDIQIEEFDMEIEIRLDLAEAKRDWNEFKKKIIDDIKDDDILGNAMAKLIDFSSYYDDDKTGAAQALTKQINNTLRELYQMDETGKSNVYGDNRTAALEDLKKYYDELMKQMYDIQKLQEEIHQSYIDMMEEAQEKFDEQIKSYEMINGLIEHDKKVISLVYGDEAYHQLSNFYEQQQTNYQAQIDFQKQEVEFWEKQMEAVEVGTEAWDEAKEKWASAAENLNNLVEASIENLQDKYLNAINAIFQDLNNKVTNGEGLDYVEEEWNLINKNAKQYLDNINRLYGIQSLENKYLDAINNTENVTAQKQLKKIMDDELKNLRERDKLTEYDIERANKKYEIALKQIALEEAQQNKTQLRLRRDSQGNYRYEYISDIEEVNQLQNELDDLYNSLYNFDKEHYLSNLNEIVDLWKEFQEKMADAAQINDPEARAERELLIQEQYGDLINGLTEQNTTIRSNLYDSAFDDLARLYDEDKNNFLEMTQQEQDAIMQDLIPSWDEGVQHMADTFIGEGGFIPTCEDAFEELNQATQDYEDGLNKLEETANIDFKNIGTGIDDVITKTKDLLENNNELINSYEAEMNAIGDVVNQLDNLVNKYNESTEAAKAAEKAAYDYWSEQQRQAAEAAAKDQAEKEQKAVQEVPKPEITKPTPEPTPAAPQNNGGDGQLNIGDKATFTGRYYATSYGEGTSGGLYSGVAQGIVVDMINGNPFGVHIHSADGKYPDLGWVRRSQLSGYDTGGYTGEWGNTGRLALLHQKELVLNQSDTKNLLNAVNIMRNITNAIGNKVLERLSFNNPNGINGNALNGVLDQHVHIEAQFPNVTNHNEIENALNNLVNSAAQYAQNKER